MQSFPLIGLPGANLSGLPTLSFVVLMMLEQEAVSEYDLNSRKATTCVGRW